MKYIGRGSNWPEFTWDGKKYTKPATTIQIDSERFIVVAEGRQPTEEDLNDIRERLVPLEGEPEAPAEPVKPARVYKVKGGGDAPEDAG
jgi:hypothetical protein